MILNSSSPFLPQGLKFLHSAQHVWQPSYHRWQLISWNEILIDLDVLLRMYPDRSHDLPRRISNLTIWLCTQPWGSSWTISCPCLTSLNWLNHVGFYTKSHADACNIKTGILKLDPGRSSLASDAQCSSPHHHIAMLLHRHPEKALITLHSSMAWIDPPSL